jgi:hypothetical protein
VPTIFFENSNNNFGETTSYLDNNRINYQTQSTNVEATLQDIVKDLSASEQLLLNIKQEMFQIPEEDSSRIKCEDLEGKLAIMLL